MNSNAKGDFGHIRAIQWFVQNGYEVFTPFSENTNHDLLVVKDGKPITVQCKYTDFIERKCYYDVYTKHQNKGDISAPYDNSVDLFFIICGNGDMYVIPGKIIVGKKHIRLSKKYNEYKVT